MTWLYAMAALAGGYLLGSVPFGYLAGRRRGVDIRQYGSKNIGATNVLRTLGALPAVLVFLADVGKGAVPAAVALWLGGDTWVQLAAGTGSLLGHTYPLFLRFKGGRAVATSLGVMTVLQPWVGLCALAAFVLVVGLTRYVSLGSMVGSLVAAVALPLLGASWPATTFGVAVSVLIIYRHRPNIERLRQGTESKLGERVAVPGPAPAPAQAAGEQRRAT